MSFVPRNGISKNRFSHLFVQSFTLIFGLGLAGAAAHAAVPADSKKPGRPFEHVPGELVVKFRDATNSTGQQRSLLQTLRTRLGKDAILGVRPFLTDNSLVVVKLKSDKQMKSAMNALGTEPLIAFSEPNYVYHAVVMPDSAGTPNDPDFSKSWSFNNVGQADSAGQMGVPGADINLLPLWQKGITGSKNVVVAVIDTGIEWTHQDLAPNLYKNPAEIDGNGKDDDGNGFIDDVHGWNFVGNTANSNDDQEHGSHCAGVIGAAGNNGVGISGINWNVSLMPVKFLDANGGGTLEGAVNAINYARMMKVNIMSNSWGGGGFSQALYDAIKASKDQGILFVAAAGNDGSNNDAGSPTYPAGYDVANIVAVAATDNKDTLASFSNYGARTVHVAAPGVNIFSTIKGNTYASLSGTSMATPHVAGIAALLLSEYPTWTFDQVKDRLIKTSTPVPGLRRKVMAKGRVNAMNALYGIIPPSDEPAENLWQTKDQVVESEHPYKDNINVTVPVSVSGAQYIRLHFDKIETENRYDQITIEKPNGEVIDQITGSVTNYTTEYFKGDSLVIRLKSDSSVNKWGFKMDKVQFIMETPSSR